MFGMLYSNQVKKTRLMILPAVFLILLFYAGPALLAGWSSPEVAAYRGNHGMTLQTPPWEKDPA